MGRGEGTKQISRRRTRAIYLHVRGGDSSSFFPSSFWVFESGKIVPEKSPQTPGHVPPDTPSWGAPGAPRANTDRGVATCQHCPTASPRCSPQTRAGRAGKLREKKEQGEKCSVLSTARGRGAPGAGGRCPSPGRAGEGGCLPAGRGLGGPFVGVPPRRRLGISSAGRSPGQPVPASRPPTRGFIYLDFWGERKFLLSTLKKIFS